MERTAPGLVYKYVDDGILTSDEHWYTTRSADTLSPFVMHDGWHQGQRVFNRRKGAKSVEQMNSARSRLERVGYGPGVNYSTKTKNTHFTFVVNLNRSYATETTTGKARMDALAAAFKVVLGRLGDQIGKGRFITCWTMSFVGHKIGAQWNAATVVGSPRFSAKVERGPNNGYLHAHCFFSVKHRMMLSIDTKAMKVWIQEQLNALNNSNTMAYHFGEDFVTGERGIFVGASYFEKQNMEADAAEAKWLAYVEKMKKDNEQYYAELQAKHAAAMREIHRRAYQDKPAVRQALQEAMWKEKYDGKSEEDMMVRVEEAEHMGGPAEPDPGPEFPGEGVVLGTGEAPAAAKKGVNMDEYLAVQAPHITGHLRPAARGANPFAELTQAGRAIRPRRARRCGRSTPATRR